ncbi:hypothetical protein [Microbacterium sp. ProA8]|uniref:hypothetical protein n=1 Tax=Microbacterium chionoecetis TaxID=3153754 RepID=UPI003267C4B1
MISSAVEPEWDEDQLDLVIAEQMVRNLTGPNGEWMPEATSDAADPMKYSGMRYVANGPFTNWAEKERLDALDAHRKAMGEGANLNGVYFTADKFEY